MRSEAAILDRLEVIEQQNLQLMAMLSRLLPEPPLPEGLSDYAAKMISLARRDPEAAKEAAREYSRQHSKRKKTTREVRI